MPRKVRQLIEDLEAAGWYLTDGGKCSHRKYAHDKSGRKVIISGQAGADVFHYQEKLVKKAIREVQL